MHTIGIDIGGTKIAGAAFDDEGREVARLHIPTPKIYERFLDAIRSVVQQVEQEAGKCRAIGVGICGIVDTATGTVRGIPNVPCARDKKVRDDISRILGRDIQFENDALCAALAEAREGCGKGHRSVFGLILGTGVGGGLVIDGRIVCGANGMCGEIGHLPLPSYEEQDGPLSDCGCGKRGCIESFISGQALSRVYRERTGKAADAKEISALAEGGDSDARHILDRYYTLVAKGMVCILHSFDPEIIAVSGGLNALPGLYDEVPKRWGKYGICAKPRTKFIRAELGPTAGVRGAALLCS